MLLSLDFLKTALPEALFFIGNRGVLTPYNNEIFVASNTYVGVAIDSRLFQSGELFVALKGASVDGHIFLSAVLEQGACAVLVSSCAWVATADAASFENKLVIQVADTDKAIRILAKAWRDRFAIPIVGITGSIGKTTTKEMLRTLLQEAGIAALVSLKNQNTVLGLCINILRLHPDHQIGVFEVGISLRGEMYERTALLRPTIGVITMIGNAHAEGLGGLQGIFEEKRTLFALLDGGGIGIINGDQPLLDKAYYAHPIARFGLKIKNQVQARKIVCVDGGEGVNTQFVLRCYGQHGLVTLQGCHSGYVLNALAAATVAYLVHVPFEHIVAGLNAYKGYEGRFEIKQLKHGRGRLVSDCYNANPESMRAALAAFSVMRSGGNKIAVLGDMLELGERAAYWHRQLGRMVRKVQDLSAVILVGPQALLAASFLPAHIVVTIAADWRFAVSALESCLQSDSLVLVKASRGMQLNNLVSAVCLD